MFGFLLLSLLFGPTALGLESHYTCIDIHGAIETCAKYKPAFILFVFLTNYFFVKAQSI